MTKTSATIPIKENDSQYYAGQYGPMSITPLLNGQTATVSFPKLNTTLISDYDTINPASPLQVRDTGNFSIHLLADSTTQPSSSNKVSPENVIVTNSSNNTIQVKNPYTTANFIFLQLTEIAIGDNYGSYSYLRLDDIINNFLFIYIGEDKILDKCKRTDVIFHARRAVQEMSYDTFKSYKSQELTVPTNLTVPIPKDYVNYTRVAWADLNGVLRTIYPLSGLSGSPYELPIQDGATGVPTQSSFHNNLEASQSIIEDRFSKATDSNISGSNPNNGSNVFDYAWYKQAYGQRYGLNPSTSQSNGWFDINQRTGMFTFSSDLVGLVIQLSYISDGLSYDLNSIVPKMAEEALYAQILHRICLGRRDIDPASKQTFKRDSYVKTRNAKIRLSELKLNEIVQVFRGQSKIIKH
tara:strand:+ start:1225 stop:2454 length:1230 start_codon:yes stop_codon:yes gene_type:complete